MISIIMPTYNCASWLEASIQSVIEQTITDWELIIIDDGSTDMSPKIISLFAETDSRIKPISLPHQGVAAVRNRGIEAARGELVTFIDSDDLWPEYTLEFLLRILKETEAEMACGGFISFLDKEEKKAISRCNKEKRKIDKAKVKLLSGKETVRESLYQRKVASSLWGKLFKRSLLKGLKMKPGEIYEDLDLFYRIALKATRVAVAEVPVYLYRQREGSILHVFNPDRLVVLDVTERMCAMLSNISPALNRAAIDRRFSANFNMLQLLAKHYQNRKATEDGSNCPSDMDKLYKRKKKEIRQFIASHAFKEIINPNVRLKNKIGALLFILLPSRWLDKVLILN